MNSIAPVCRPFRLFVRRHLLLAPVQPQLATVRFRCFTYDPWPIVVVGSLPDLGDWYPKRALPMQLEAEFNGVREWATSFDCSSGQAFEFKFVAVAEWGPLWEAGENRNCSPDDRWTEIADEFRQ